MEGVLFVRQIPSRCLDPSLGGVMRRFAQETLGVEPRDPRVEPTTRLEISSTDMAKTKKGPIFFAIGLEAIRPGVLS